MSGPLILLVDDEDDLREVTTLVLEEAGYRVHASIHGGKAIEALEGGLAPDAIILDLTMPVRNGWDVWDWLQQSTFATVPVVIWTATGLTDGSVSTARVVSKSEPRELLKVLRELTGTTAPPQGGASPGTANAPGAAVAASAAARDGVDAGAGAPGERGTGDDDA